MNPFFQQGYKTEDVPSRFYARLDKTEPDIEILPEEDGPVRFSYDAISADWFDSAAGLLLPDADSFQVDRDTGQELFRKMPLFQIEIDDPSDRSFRSFAEAGASDWLELKLNASGDGAEVYPSLFSEPLHRGVESVSKVADPAALNAAFSMGGQPLASAGSVAHRLSPSAALDRLAMLDVGQGLSMAVVKDDGNASFYYDVGAGVTSNRSTTPTRLAFCTNGDPAIVLSHWDADHWAGSVLDTSLLARNWVVPYEPAATASILAHCANILSAGGSISLVPPGPLIWTWTANGQRFTLARGTGKGRNQSGLVLAVENLEADVAWLMTGDVDYSNIPAHVLQSLHPIAALGAPHHGGRMKARASVPKPAPIYNRLLYSYGPGNTHRHPVWPTVDDHDRAGWDSTVQTKRNPGSKILPGDTLTTAEHPGSHRNGAVAGWTAPPTTPSPFETRCAPPITQR